MPPLSDDATPPPKPRWRRLLSLDVAAVLLCVIVLLGDALFLAPRPRSAPASPAKSVPAQVAR